MVHEHVGFERQLESDNKEEKVQVLYLFAQTCNKIELDILSK